jgi:hypothetical protein
MGRLAKSGPGAQFDGLGDPVNDRARDGESTLCWRRVASTSMLIVNDAGLPEVILPRRAAPTEPVSANSVMEMSAAGSPELVHRRTGGSVAVPIARTALVSIDVPGIAQSQGSLKPLVRGGKVVLIHDNRRLRPWRDVLIWHAREAMADRPPMRGPVGIEVEIRLPRPKSHFGRRGLRQWSWRWSLEPPT